MMSPLIKKTIFSIFISSFIFTNYNSDLQESIEYVLDGNYIYKNKYISNENNESYYYNKINSIMSSDDNQNMFLKALIEPEGSLSKLYFEDFYMNYPQNKYADFSVVKIADYYYAKGLYIQASDWYKKIYSEYSDSVHLEKSISYYLNSLLVSGQKDTANFYIKKFKRDFPSLKFANDSSSPLNTRKKLLKKKNNSIIKKYSVQIGSFKNYDLAKKKKNILTNEGFFCRIDQIFVNGQVFYAVRSGTFKSQKLAKKEQVRLISRIGLYDSIVVEVN